MNNVTLKVVIEVAQKPEGEWNSVTIARSSIEDAGTMTLDQLKESLDAIIGDAQVRVNAQLDNTLRIKAIEEKNRMLAAPQGSS